MKKISLLITLLCAGIIVTAQNNFMIYSFKGNVTLIENATENKVKVGKTMNSSATIKIPAGGVATIVCNEATMFTINKPGSYPLSKFGDSCKVNHSSFTSNYIKYVWNQMTKINGSPGSNRKAFMNTVGAVSRSINNIWIDPRLDTVNYSGVAGTFPLSWKSYAEAKEFNFSLYTADNSTTAVYSTTVTKLKIPLTAFVSKLKPGTSYHWVSAIKGEENDERKVLNFVSKESFAALLETLKTQGAQFEAPAEQAYRLGFMLEDAHYLAEALDYYAQAAKLDPTNVLYRSTLMSFKKDYEVK
ncbi:MAG TPA: tetratricopeptide repeat protein [Chitinophagaceae bacterium]|jgi:hypothetical protein|nr:tetratricopeptide repeat protein [Chitinophagaceae bacterium]HPN59678.1 tetratricopeptide repeat protein [Chitinophagaceae bacterium]